MEHEARLWNEGEKNSSYGSSRNFIKYLKVPKHENFSLAFFALSEPIWVGDEGIGKKIWFFYQLAPDFDSFWFFAAYWVCGKQKQNLKLG
jgi:hypothetical protein